MSGPLAHVSRITRRFSRRSRYAPATLRPASLPTGATPKAGSSPLKPPVQPAPQADKGQLSGKLFNPFEMSPVQRRSPATPAASAAVARMIHAAGIDLRDARIRRRWTLRETADRAGVAVASAHAAESGGPVSLETYARLAIALGQRPVLSFEARPTSGSKDRLRSGQDLVHAAMGEAEARQLGQHGYTVALDEPYQHFQFAGRADLLAWDLDTRSLLHIENKTRLLDLQDLAGSFNAKRAYLPSVMAERLRLGPTGWRTVTHALVVLWSSEVLHVLRIRPASFTALCPSPLDSFSAWWNGRSPLPGVTSSLVIFDPAPALSSRRPRFVGADRLGIVGPRYPGYAAAAAALDERTMSAAKKA